VLLKELSPLTAIAWRVRRRVHQLGTWSAEHTIAWRKASDALATQPTAMEEKHAGPEHSGEHSGAA
jgi:hypothetical protein